MRVCIVGRKQVGKTRFCMALLGKRYINASTIDFHEYEFANHTIIDTPHCDNLHLFNPDLCLVMVDGSKTLSAEDNECISQVRKQNIPFEIVVGFGTDKINVSDLPKNVKVHFLTTKESIEQFRSETFGVLENEVQATENLKWVIVGKENAGKSTLFNALFGDSRVQVSSTPGTTKQGVEVHSKGRIMQDTAGVKTNNLSYIKTLLHKNVLVIFVIDGVKGLSHGDKRLLGYVKQLGLPCVCAVNKADHPEFSKQPELLHLFKFIPVIEISALKGTNLKKLRDVCRQVEKAALHKISNKELMEWLEADKHKFHLIKVKYAKHLNLSPYEVLFFVAPMASRSQTAHIVNLFQKHFNLNGIFVNAKIKAARSAKRAAAVPVAVKEKRKRKVRNLCAG